MITALTSRADPASMATGRDRLVLAGEIEQLFVSDSGHYLLVGWLADEGGGASHLALGWGEEVVEVPRDGVLRHARGDVEDRVRGSGYDHGIIAFGRCSSSAWLKRPLLVVVCSASQLLTRVVLPELIADGRLLDRFLVLVGTARMHAGTEAVVYRYLAGTAGSVAVALFEAGLVRDLSLCQVQRFGCRAVERSFVTVLFGRTDAVLLGPALFRQDGIPTGEWVYVCNAPEDAATVLRLAKIVSDLHDVMVTVVVPGGNVGFGAGNNAGVAAAASDEIILLNPDVFPSTDHAGALARFVGTRDFGNTLWGGLLFYDDATLMHAGMYLEADTCLGTAATLPGTGLLRVEHFCKGIPFDVARWNAPWAVPAVTGAAMAFRRPAFERIGGFSTRYIYGHYEDADLSLRWAETNGPVAVDPDFRLLHLEGQGSRPPGEQHRAAASLNRYLFTLRHGAKSAAARPAA